jgi:formylglycine-generating enzyme required for sulfatase activity
MKSAYEKVMALQKQNGDADKKKIARERFLQYFVADLDWTREDETMRLGIQYGIEINWVFVEGRPRGAFYMSATEVTFDQYDKFCEVTGYDKPKADFGRGKQPVVNVNVADAVAFCDWLSKETGKTVRLPEEDEWEYAAKGGNKSKGCEYSGSNNIGEVAWYEGNSGGKTHEVGMKNPNELGLYDMSGNVFEWCGTRGWIRGGSWLDDDDKCRVSYRGGSGAGYRSSNYGFRLLQN